MKKTIIIGIGGTGLSAIRELRRLIAECYEKGLQAPEVASIKFIYIDTAPNEITRYTWSVLGKDISLTPAEQLIITGDRMGEIVQNPQNFPYINAWLPMIKDYVGEPGAGAKGVRPYGRLIYEYLENKNKVKTILDNIYFTLNQASEPRDLRVYLICSLSGGTGSGIFLPLSFDLINWNLYRKDTLDKFYSFLVIPPLSIVGRHERYHANAYAALKEINYYAFTTQGLPYDNCYILEPQAFYGTSTLDDLPLLIAQRIFLNIQGVRVSHLTDAIMDNPTLKNVESDPITGDKHALCFSTFGISTISFSREIVSQYLAYQLAFSLVSSWSNPTNYPQDINARVRAELDSINLSKSHCLGERDQFGNLLSNIYIEIQKKVEESLRDVTSRKLANSAERIRKELEDGFRGKGLNQYYKQLDADIQGVVNVAIELTRKKITSFLLDTQHGLDFCQIFLEKLISVLEEFKDDFSYHSSKYEQQVNRYRNIFTDTVYSVRKRESGLLYISFAKDRDNIKRVINDYLKSIVSFRANQYGLKFVRIILPEIINIQIELNKCENKIHEISQQIQEKINSFLQEFNQDIKNNSKIIVHQKTINLNQWVQEIDLTTINAELKKRIYLQQEQQELDIIRLLHLPNLEQVLIRVAYEWILSNNFPKSISNLTFYDKFVKQYSDKNERQIILKTAQNLSAPFLKFSPSEVNLNQNNTSIIELTIVPYFDNNQVQDGINNHPNHLVTQDDLNAIGVFQTENSIDENRIIFLKETQSFPLRFIESLKFYQSQYQQYPLKSVLHIDKNIIGYLYDIYLTNKEQDKAKKEAEEVFLLAQALNWISLEISKTTNKKEICFNHRQEGLLGTQRYVLGANWHEALDTFAEDAVAAIVHSNTEYNIRTARVILTSRYRQKYQDAKRNFDIYQELNTQLDEFFEQRLQAYVHDDYRYYQKCQAIANRISEKTISAKDQNIRKIEQFFQQAKSKIRRNGDVLEVESTIGQLSSHSPFPAMLFDKPTEKDVSKLVKYSVELKKDGEYRISLLLYKDPPDTLALFQMAQYRVRDHFIIIPIPFAAIEQALVDKSIALGLLAQYINRYMLGADFFNDRNAIGDTLSFFGQSNLLIGLEEDLRRLQNIGLFGLRKSGKTSILLQLGLSMREHPVVHIDLQPYAGKLHYGTELFNKILEKLLSLTKTDPGQQQGFTLFNSDRPAKDFTTDFMKQFSSLASILWAVDYKKPILCFLDEIERILPTEIDQPEEARQRIEEFNAVFGTLRALNQESRLISLLVADLHADCNSINNWHLSGLPTNPVYKFFKEVYVTPFTQEETTQMLTDIGHLMRVEFEDVLLTAIHQGSGGYPFISRQIASLLCRKANKEMNDHGELITASAASRYLKKLFSYSDLADYFEKNIWDNLQNRKDRNFSEATASIGILKLLSCNEGLTEGIQEEVIFERLSENCSESECEKALRWLEAVGLVARLELSHGDSYRPKVPLMTNWLWREMKPEEIGLWKLS